MDTSELVVRAKRGDAPDELTIGPECSRQFGGRRRRHRRLSLLPVGRQVGEWLGAAGLVIAEDVVDMSYGEWGYRHLLLRRG